jgi:hypothetical protein
MTVDGWKDLVIMGEIITDMVKAIEMVRASSRQNIQLIQFLDDGVSRHEWDNF